MRATKNTQSKPVSRWPTPLHCITGILALALACFSALCIYFYATPAHASTANQQANGQTSSAHVVFDDTETETPSQTPTNTPSSTVTSTPTSTVTSTSTPAPSPSVTHTATPFPTSTRSATSTAQPSSTATSKQTPSPVSTSTGITTQGTGVNQTPVASPAPTKKQSDQSAQVANQSSNTFPFVPLIISLGSLLLLGLLLKGWWGILHRPSSAARSPKLDLGGATAWSRTRNNNPQDAIMAQRAYDLAVPGRGAATGDRHAQTLQPGAMTPVSSFSSPGNVTNNTPYSGATTSAGFYTYPGMRQPGGLITPAGSQHIGVSDMPTVARVPVTNQPVLQTQTGGERSTDGLGLSDPALRATIESYIV
jgi:hypothetical protein